MSHELFARTQKDEIDSKITKRHFPRNNNESVLDFVFEKDPNNYLRKNKILIKGNIEVDKRFVTESGFAHKLFSMMTVSVNSQIVTKNNNKYLLCSFYVDIHFFFSAEYFLGDYLQKICNFNVSTIGSVYSTEGYHDVYNFRDLNDMASTTVALRQRFGHELNTGKLTYEFTLTPCVGFLGSPQPLLTNCELEISFDRSKAQNVLLEKTAVAAADKPANDYIKINDCVAITEWISSESLRDYFMTIENNPIIYEYDDCDIYIKNIPSETTDIRIDNFRGGNIPEYLFAGIIPQKCLKGDYKMSSTCFEDNDVIAFNITLNGSSVNGYPIEVSKGCSAFTMQKFFDVTNRYYNIQCGENLSKTKFDYNYLWSHKFEGEETPQGWLGINLKLKNAFAKQTPMSLIIWTISKNALSIDKFHQIRKINL